MFHPVGHGLFYSGIIKNLNTDKQYSFLYDCGGCKEGYTKAIDNVVPPNNEIDLLIISHFHADHIKGVLELIGRKTKIGTVILPHLDQTSKILYTSALADEKYNLQRSEPEYLKKFISDPESVLGDAEVYFISNNERITRQYPEKKKDFIFSWTNNMDAEIQENDSTNANLHPKLKSIWSFHFFMPERAYNFNELEDFFETQGITCENAIDKWVIIKDKIEKLKLNNNISNLVCAHGPTENVSIQTICNNKFIPSKLFNHCWEYDCLFYHHYRRWHEENIGFQFLTGDAEINDQKKFLNRYQDYLDKSILFQVPHHGSKENWKDWFSEYQPFCNLWPVTHNLDHKYGLPSATFSYIAPYSVTEYEPTRLGIQIHFDI